MFLFYFILFIYLFFTYSLQKEKMLIKATSPFWWDTLILQSIIISLPARMESAAIISALFCNVSTMVSLWMWTY